MANKIVKFEDTKKEAQEVDMTEAQIKDAIINNDLLKMAVRIITGHRIEDESLDEIKLFDEYKKDAIKNKKKFQSLGDIDNAAIQFYYSLFDLGYRTFGAAFFTAMINSVDNIDTIKNEKGEEVEVPNNNVVHFYKGTWALVEGMNSLSTTLANFNRKLLAYESLELTEEQKKQYEKKYNEYDDFNKIIEAEAKKLEDNNKA